MEWIVRVNTKTGKILKEKASQEEMRWGGRLLIAKFLLREVPPTCDPLGRYNSRRYNEHCECNDKTPICFIFSSNLVRVSGVTLNNIPLEIHQR